MTGFDYAFLFVLGLSCLLGFWRGLLSEVFSLLGWLVALFVAWHLAGLVAPHLRGQVSSESLRWLLAFVLIFVASLLLLGLARMLLKGMLGAVGLSVIDRILGACFGALRALILALILVMAAGLTSLPHEEWWRESCFAPPLETVVIAGKPWLPLIIAKRIKYR